MKLSIECMKQLELIFSGDIAHATWHTDHALDAERWFRFVDQYAIDHRFHVDESDLIQEIASIAGVKTDRNDNPMLEPIIDLVSLMVNILHFLKTTGREPTSRIDSP